ncbi:MAG: TIGR01777 family oxidoreductase [Chloroflexota bacterium]
MRAIITGGTGLIGSQLARLLGQEGNDVVILSRNPSRYAGQMPAGARLMQWDARTPDGWAHLLDEEDTFIINLAGHNPANWRWTEAHKQRVLDSRIAVTEAVVKAIQDATHKPHALIQASAVGYYGNTGEHAINEHAPPTHDWRAQVCVHWEARAAQSGVRTVMLRIGIVLDQHGGAFPPFMAATDLFGSRLGDGTQWIPWVHNDDVATTIRFLMHHREAEGPYNITAPEPVRNHEFMDTLAHVRGRPSWIPVPAFALRAVMGEQADVVLDSQRILPQKLLEAGYKFRYPDVESALRDILSRPKHWESKHHDAK